MEINIKFDEKMIVEVANRVLDEYEYNGKTIREWADLIANPKTNADRIRSMSDEELAKMMEDNGDCPPRACPHEEEGAKITRQDCEMCWLKWLKEEVSE